MAQQLSTNTFGVAKWVVSPDPTQGTHTTIGAAMAVASSGDSIFIRDGTYTENITVTPGVDLVAFEVNALTPTVTIIGKLSYSGAGTFSVCGINLQTNGDYFLEVTGSSGSIVWLRNCFFNMTNNTGINFTSSGVSSFIHCNFCRGNIGALGVALFNNSSAGSLFFTYCTINNSGVSTTASMHTGTNSVGLFYSFISTVITKSGSGNLGASFCNVDASNLNVPCFTLSGGGTYFFEFCQLVSGSSECVVINPTSPLNLFHCELDSLNTVAITGTGTVNYDSISFLSNANQFSGTLTLGLGLSTPSNAPSGYVWKSTGTNTSPTWQPLASNISSVTTVTSAASPYTVLTTDEYLSVDSSGGAVTLLFPDTPTVGQEWTVKDNKGTAAINNITVTTVSGLDLIDGATTFVINSAYQSIQLIAVSSVKYSIY